MSRTVRRSTSWPYATQASNPRLADPRLVCYTTKTCGPRLGQDFIHLNGETVLNESTSAALDVTLELYGEGGCCLTWANRHVFQPRTLSYTVTLTANRARREASEAAVAEQRTERERREESTRELTEQVAQLTLAQHAAQVLRPAAATTTTTTTTTTSHTAGGA